MEMRQSGYEEARQEATSFTASGATQEIGNLVKKHQKEAYGLLRQTAMSPTTHSLARITLPASGASA